MRIVHSQLSLFVVVDTLKELDKALTEDQAAEAALGMDLEDLLPVELELPVKETQVAVELDQVYSVELPEAVAEHKVVDPITKEIQEALEELEEQIL